MPNLIETYARSTGLKIDRPWIKRDYWPLPFDRYITLSASSGQAAKSYDHWQLVIDMLNPLIASHGIHIVQLGDKETPLFSGTYDLRGKMTVPQSAHLVQHAAAHMGNDSWSAHAGAALGTPVVALYGTTDSYLHGPHWKDPTKTVLLSSHRNGRKPTFGAEGVPKSVNLIRPEEVANAVLSLLGLTERVTQSTTFIGPLYPHTIFDWVPNAAPCLNLGPDVPITVRLDLEHSEQNLVALLQTGRKVTIVTKLPIDLRVLQQYRAQILSYSHEIDMECPLGYPPTVKRIIQNAAFFTRLADAAQVAALRYRFFDIVVIEQVLPSTLADYARESATYLNKPLDTPPQIDRLYMRTNKLIMSRGQIYLTHAHEARSLPTLSIDAKETAVIDDPALWRDLAHYLLYTKD